MSAIFGIWHLTGDRVKEEHLQKMKDKVLHYGRDEQDIQIHRNIGLGCCLNKIGRHAQGDVPIYYDVSQELVFAGDAMIYNREELLGKCGLTGNKEISNQALILETYKKWGDDCPKYLNGDFAFVIWEKRKKQLLIARDHLGVRPLYYFCDQSTVAFSTDYRALLTLPFVRREIDEKTMYAHLGKIINFNPEATFFEKIIALPQAHILRIDEYGFHKNKYWTPGKNGKIVYKTEEEYTKALYSLVNDAITIRVRSTDKKLAAELSGGLDSSVITILANRELAKQGEKLELFSWSPPFTFVEKMPNDERTLLEQVCRQENLACTFFDPTSPSKNKMEILPPDAGDAVIIIQESEIMASRGVALVLSGWGGDQGISHRANLFELFLTGYWGHLLKEIKHLSIGSTLQFIKLLISNTVYQLFKSYSYFGHPNKDVAQFVNKHVAKRMKRYGKKNILYFSLSPVKHIESGYIQTRTEQAAWIDAVHSIQHLYPFLDYRVVDFAMSVPRHLYFKNAMSRYIYRETFKDILPKEIYQFTSKDDIAKSTYLTIVLKDTLANIRQVVNKLNRGLFSAYIDFDTLFRQLDSLAADDKKNILVMKRRILSCYHIQQIIEDAEKSDQCYKNGI